MKEHTRQPECQSRTLDSNPCASKQDLIVDILQAYKDRTLGRPVQRTSAEDEDTLQSKAANQASITDILQRYKVTTQRYASTEEDDVLQGKFELAPRTMEEDDELTQGKFDSLADAEQRSVQREVKPNNTVLPDKLKTGIENLSGFSMDDVKVHYNSSKPTQLQVLAYAQGTDIHIAAGQEKHLPHEAWHVVQQKQGRVQPTTQLQGVDLNDNEELEKEADLIKRKITQKTQLIDSGVQLRNSVKCTQQKSDIIQRGSEKIDESKGCSFKYGLIKGTFSPSTNTADMHVEPKTEEQKFALKDVYLAFTFVYNKMVEQEKKTHSKGKLFWNPQGAAVIKMVVELIGQSFGEKKLLKIAEDEKQTRKSAGVKGTGGDVFAEELIAEHIAYLNSVWNTTRSITIGAVIPNEMSETNYNQDLLKDRELFNLYTSALNRKRSVSLRITIGQDELKSLIDTLPS